MLKFYLVSTLISVVVCTITGIAIGKRLKREGYGKNVKYTAWEFIHSSLVLFVPIFNIFLALLSIFNSEDLYEKVKAKRIKEKEGKNERV